MVRIVADTSTMYSSQEAREAGFAVSPLAVTINNETYRELDEITPDAFVGLIRQGHMPRSSQPAIGDVMALYEEYQGEPILNISMADGLSGTYSTAVSAAQSADNSADIAVINTGTLCGPHRYMVEAAAKLAKAGCALQEIVEKVEALMKTDKSFLIPSDFDYLRRGGRLSPLVSLVGKTIKLAPVLTQSEDGRQLIMSAVKRSFKQAIAHVSRELSDWGVGEGWRIYVTHAAAPDMAQAAKAALEQAFAKATLEIHQLTPAFITQGGPGCVAIQVVRELQEA